MRTRKILAVCLLTAAATISPAHAKEIVILLSGGSELRAELLSVRDSAIVICLKVDVSNDELLRNPRLATVLPFQRVDRIKMEGKSYVITGLLLGALGGGIAGGLIGSQVTTESERNPDFFTTVFVAPVERTAHTATGILVGGLGGLLLGAMIGGGASTPETILDPRGRGQREVLREFARFPRQEPEFLKDASAE
jgi:hypothetical protein